MSVVDELMRWVYAACLHPAKVFVVAPLIIVLCMALRKTLR
jgi:hypothetical protein